MPAPDGPTTQQVSSLTAAGGGLEGGGGAAVDVGPGKMRGAVGTGRDVTGFLRGCLDLEAGRTTTALVATGRRLVAVDVTMVATIGCCGDGL